MIETVLIFYSNCKLLTQKQTSKFQLLTNLFTKLITVINLAKRGIRVKTLNKALVKVLQVQYLQYLKTFFILL